MVEAAEEAEVDAEDAVVPPRSFPISYYNPLIVIKARRKDRGQPALTVEELEKAIKNGAGLKRFKCFKGDKVMSGDIRKDLAKDALNLVHIRINNNGPQEDSDK